MKDLLAALAGDPQRQRRRASVAAVVAGVLLAGGALAQRAFQGSGPSVCRNPGVRLATVWETPQSNSSGAYPRRDATLAAFMATGAPRSADVWKRVAAILDGYATRWTAMHTETCEATHVRGEQSAEVLDLRMGCLNNSRDSLRALVDVFRSADAETVGNAIDAANALPDLARCADVALLRSVPPPPSDPKLRQQVEGLRHRAAEARALGNAGHWKDGIARTRSLLEEAAKAAYQPLVAELEAQLGWLNAMIGERKPEVEAYERALAVAEVARYDEIAAQSAVMLVGCVGYFFGHPDEAERWARFAAALLQRMGPGQERLQAWLAHNRGINRASVGQFSTAESDFRTAIALKRKIDGGDSVDVAQSINALAELEERRGDFAAAFALSDQALAIYERTHGPGSVLSAMEYGNRCEYLNGLGRFAEALDSCQKSLAIFHTTVEPDHAWLGYAFTSTGLALMGLHRPREALAPLQHALDIRRSREQIPGDRGDTLFALARAQWDAGGDRAAARANAQAARADYETAPGADTKVRAVNSWLAEHAESRRR